MAGLSEGAPKPKRRRARRFQWTAEQKERFLDHLAATCNIAASAREVDVCPKAVTRLSRTDAAFRQEWDGAIEGGYQMLETRLIGHALAGGGDAMTGGDAETTGPINPQLAMNMLTLHRNRRDGLHKKSGAKLRTSTPEETDASILRKLKAMQRGKARRA